MRGPVWGVAYITMGGMDSDTRYTLSVIQDSPELECEYDTGTAEEVWMIPYQWKPPAGKVHLGVEIMEPRPTVDSERVTVAEKILLGVFHMQAVAPWQHTEDGLWAAAIY